MAGVAGRSGGGGAKRPEQKLGKPTKAQALTPGFTRVDASDEPPPVIPDPNWEWGVAAKHVWDSVLSSPTRIYAESLDYAYLYVVCEAVDALQISGYKAAPLGAVQSMFKDLGMTEIQRRSAKLLIDRTPAPPTLTPVSQIDAARKAFEGD